MANITKRTGKDGSVSYLIRVFAGEDSKGKQIVKTKTYRPPKDMRPSTAEKEAGKVAILFEDQVRSGFVAFDNNTSFGEYATAWVKNEPLAPKTRDRYEDLLTRINAALGHISLSKLQARHLEEFYRNLAEAGINKKGTYAVSDKLATVLDKKNISRQKVSEIAKCSASTVGTAAAGTPIRLEKASAISAALGMEVTDLFTVHQSDRSLSDRTINHHHRLISAILAKAKKERLVPFNVAKEHATAPKVKRKEAAYMDDEAARKFLSCLEAEEDIRIKTILILALFTGVRRGELCGLQWDDIDFEGLVVHVRRASQYQKGLGVVTVPTKNTNSVRSIDVPRYVMDLLKTYYTWWTERRFMWGKDWQGHENRLFIQEDGKPLAPDTVNYWLDKFTNKNGLPHISVHSLRHTFATLQITSGVDIRTLQSRTGHSQASTLINTYSHAVKSAQEAAAGALENVLLHKHA